MWADCDVMWEVWPSPSLLFVYTSLWTICCLLILHNSNEDATSSTFLRRLVWIHLTAPLTNNHLPVPLSQFNLIRHIMNPDHSHVSLEGNELNLGGESRKGDLSQLGGSTKTRTSTAASIWSKPAAGFGTFPAAPFNPGRFRISSRISEHLPVCSLLCTSLFLSLKKQRCPDS